MNLVNFHRVGFRVQGDQVLDKRYINSTLDSFRYYILHFGYCVQRQENLETTWNNAHPPSQHIHLKKRCPLPFFNKGQRKSIYIDKRGLYYILNEYRNAVNEYRVSLPIDTPEFQFPTTLPFPSVEKKFNEDMFVQWMKYLFRMEKVLDGTKIFKRTGVGFTTNAVCASVLYNTPSPPDEEEEELLLSIQQLSLTPPDDYEEEDDDDDVEDNGDEIIDDEERNCRDEEVIIQDNSSVLSAYIHDGTLYQFYYYFLFVP